MAAFASPVKAVISAFPREREVYGPPHPRPLI